MVKMGQSLIFTLDKWSDSLCLVVPVLPQPLQHVLSLDDWLMRNFFRNAHPLEKREKLG